MGQPSLAPFLGLAAVLVVIICAFATIPIRPPEDPFVALAVPSEYEYDVYVGRDKVSSDELSQMLAMRLLIDRLG